MSEENVEIVRRAVEAVSAGADVFAQGLASTEAQWHAVREFPAAGTYVGPEGFAEFIALWTENFDDWTLQVTEAQDAADKVVAFAHQVAVGKASGIRVEMDFALLFTLNDGLITDARAF